MTFRQDSRQCAAGAGKRFAPALLSASGESNIALTGTGQVDGIGNPRRWEPDVDPNEFRFSLFRFVECREIKLHDVGLYWTGAWAVHLLRCEDGQVRGCDIIARRDRINSDGIDPDDCPNGQATRSTHVIHNCRSCEIEISGPHTAA